MELLTLPSRRTRLPAGVKCIEQDPRLSLGLYWPSLLAIAFFYFALFLSIVVGSSGERPLHV